MEMKFSVRMKALFGQEWHGNEVFCPNEALFGQDRQENEETCPNEGHIQTGLSKI
jgi:hypothetical protein